MDTPLMSNDFVICMLRQLSNAEPGMIISNIKKKISKAWTMYLRNNTQVLKSSQFSLRKDPLKHHLPVKGDRFHNFTGFVETQYYKQLYGILRFAITSHVITKLYLCDQIELKPSEFLLNNENDTIYYYSTKRFLYDGQFVLVHGKTHDEYHARICIDDSNFYKRNLGAIPKQHYPFSVFAIVLFMFLLYNYYRM